VHFDINGVTTLVIAQYCPSIETKMHCAKRENYEDYFSSRFSERRKSKILNESPGEPENLAQPTLRAPEKLGPANLDRT
jgi:hypothetical protein